MSSSLHPSAGHPAPGEAPGDREQPSEQLMRQEVQLLLIDVDPDTDAVIDATCRDFVRRIDRAANMSATLRRLGDAPYHVIVVDVARGQQSGDLLHLVRYLAENRPDAAVVVVAGADQMRLAVTAMRTGAFDLLSKPVQAESVRHTIERAASHALVERRLHRLAGDEPHVADTPIIGSSETVRAMLERIARIADTDVTVLISGESGTGKELVARTLHQNSSRGGPFVAVNCAALPAELMEAELFGHVRGAFTDAKRDKSGLFLEAQGGTLFLDEIGEMPQSMQVKLLRTLQERAVRPVGGSAEIPFDVRVVAATNRDLEHEVRIGQFREDLYYRLNVVRVATPPLRDRPDDVPLLAHHFLARWSEELRKPTRGITPEAMATLQAHDWPGNVRELENVVQRAVALCAADQVTPADLGDLAGVPDFAPIGASSSIEIAVGGPAPFRSPSAASPAPAETLPPASSVRPVAPAVVSQPQPTPQPQANAAPRPAPWSADPALASAEYRPAPSYPAPVDAAPAARETSEASVAGGTPLQIMQRAIADALREIGDIERDGVPTLDRFDQIYIVGILEACGGNKTRAAEILGLARRTLYRRLRNLDADETSPATHVAERRGPTSAQRAEGAERDDAEASPRPVASSSTPTGDVI